MALKCVLQPTKVKLFYWKQAGRFVRTPTSSSPAPARPEQQILALLWSSRLEKVSSRPLLLPILINHSAEEEEEDWLGFKPAANSASSASWPANELFARPAKALPKSKQQMLEWAPDRSIRPPSPPKTNRIRASRTATNESGHHLNHLHHLHHLHQRHHGHHLHR